ncbi:acetylornithine aminotransferase [Nocardioides baekrokdamisoli]|uniref:Acetylornithine aminotransferase n=1 Tax=Nocardioides baekrokdamisoli TaxID=1804624 RepID=A0A3G9J5T6_9ACTN|nr:acetylornithine transaminase [Nocardioides baekrokdamisoli]BBH18369.1 acetylornithine aminotransferase [Nocardioides baekrokdamisoli]
MTSQGLSASERYSGALMNTFGTPKLVLAKGDGTHVWDENGKAYLDLLGGIAVNALGHAHPAVVAAVAQQFGALGHISNFFASRPQIELAEKLRDLVAQTYAGAGETKVFFTNSGAEANEAAFKITRRTGRTHIVAMEGSFHGRTMGALAVTSKEAYRTPFEPLPGDVTFVPFGDVSALEAAVSESTAAIVVEPIQGEGGVLVPPAGFLAEVRRIADAHGALMWVDEIQTGVGRTGSWFANAEATPDLITLAKGLGGGFPIGACIGIGRAASLLEPGNHGTTFGGNPPACAVALAVITTIEEQGLLDHVASIGAALTNALAADPRVSEISGRGLLVGATVSVDAGKVVAAAQHHGVILNAATPNRVRLAPAYVLSEADVTEFAEKWSTILDTAEAL